MSFDISWGKAGIVAIVAYPEPVGNSAVVVPEIVIFAIRPHVVTVTVRPLLEPLYVSGVKAELTYEIACHSDQYDPTFF